MALKLITAPSASLVTLPEAKRHVRVDHDDDDTYIQSLIDAASAHLDGPEPAWLGRSIAVQTWQLRIDEFPADKVYLPLPPLNSVSEIEYLDADGDAQTVSSFRSFGVDSVNSGGYVMPAYNEDWPETRGEPEAVRIKFIAGYSSIPKPVKHAALLLIGHWYEYREAATEHRLEEAPMAVQRLLSPFKFWYSH